jgi:hypothetical protein
MTLWGVRFRLRRPGGSWPVLVIGISAALVTVSALWLASQSIDDTEDRIEQERLALAELAAVHADHILTEAFFELEVVAKSIRPGSDAERTVVTNFSAPLLQLDTEGRATAIGESGSFGSAVDPRAAEIAATLSGTTDRSISASFVLPVTGHHTVALSIPIFDDHGAPGTIVGFLDVDEHIRDDLARVIAQFGESAHADVVDAQGILIASSAHEADETPEDHADFYRRAVSDRLPTVELIPDADGSSQHVVAYAPMGGAPWGVALGANEADTFRAPDARRRELVSMSIASTVTFAFAVLLITVEVQGRPRGETAWRLWWRP